MQTVSGAVAFVTGGAGGIGLGIARHSPMQARKLPSSTSRTICSLRHANGLPTKAGQTAALPFTSM